MDVTAFHKLPIGEFLSKMVQFISDQSKAEDAKSFPELPNIPDIFWTIASIYAENFEKIMIFRNSSYYMKRKDLHFHYFTNGEIPKNLKKKLDEMTDESILEKLSAPELKLIRLYVSPEEIVSYRNMVDVLKIVKVRIKSNYLESSCTCQDFFARMCCPHLLTGLLYEEKIKAPILLKPNKKRGRPKKVSPARK